MKNMKTPMKVLLLGVLLSHLGTYLVVPLLPIFLKQKGISVLEIGWILAAIPFAFQAGSLLGGWLADRIGRKTVIAVGAWINAGALVGYALFDRLWILIGIGLLSGLGVGLNAPSTKAAISALASMGEGTTTSAFSQRGIAANIGISVAGLLSFFVLGGASAMIFYTAAGLYAVLGAFSLLMLPGGSVNQSSGTAPVRSYMQIFRNKAFIVFSLISMFMWALYTQLSVSLPLRADDILPDPSVVSLIWTINSIVVIVLQTTISRAIIERIHPMYSLALGTLLIGGSLGTIYWSANFYWMLVSGVIFIFGEMLIVPTTDVLVSKMAKAQMLGVFFGITNFVSGTGEGIGKFVGSRLLSVGTSSSIPWFTFFLWGIVISGTLVAMRFWKPLQTIIDD